MESSDLVYKSKDEMGEEMWHTLNAYFQMCMDAHTIRLKQDDCKFCHEPYKEMPSKSSMAISITSRNAEIKVLDDNDNIISSKISYCPKCGRSLEGDLYH